MSSNIQTIRFRHPKSNDQKANPETPKRIDRHSGILQDQLRRSQRAPWCPSFSLAVRILLLVRFAAAMYSNIQDCDEVFNYWEPLHYLDRGYGFQTWETSPVYAIRSYAYILVHLLPAKIPSWILGAEKRATFFAVRIVLGVTSTLCEAKLYRMVLAKVNYRVARYMLVMMATSAGMWNASTALLPSSFAMYFITLAFAYTLEPASSVNSRRTLHATILFATAAIVGWPFAIVIAVPFVIEELFIFAGDIVPSQDRNMWLVHRWASLWRSGVVASLIFLPVIVIDSLAYGKPSVVPWNIIKYNIFSATSGRGPELYGTAPWNFYIYNLALNFNGILLLALFSLPALGITSYVDKKRLGSATSGPQRSSRFTLLAMRLLPLYLWIGILSTQPHKEERFMFPVYTLICFNAAVTLYLIRGWFEVAYIKATKSPYQASRSSLFSRLTFSVVITTSLLSFSRIMALWNYYHAPMTVVFQFEHHELPRLLNATGHIHLPNHTRPEEETRVDLSPLKDFGIRLCIGKEWYRFPGSYLVPDGVRIDWVKSEFDGLMPGHFSEASRQTFWLRDGTRAIPEGMNDLNQEESIHHADISTCDYLIDLDFPLHPVFSPHEPRYVLDEAWEKVTCAPFLDGRYSTMITRTLWIPGEMWQRGNEWGEYCLLKSVGRVGRKETELRIQQ